MWYIYNLNGIWGAGIEMKSTTIGSQKMSLLQPTSLKSSLDLYELVWHTPTYWLSFSLKNFSVGYFSKQPQCVNCFYVCAALIYPCSLGIFLSNTFFVKLPKPCSRGQNHIVLETMGGKGEGMLSLMDRNVSPCPGHNAQFSPGPRQKNMPFWNARWRFVWAIHYITVTCLSVGLFKTDGRTDQGFWTRPLCSKAMNHTHSLTSAECFSSW